MRHNQNLGFSLWVAKVGAVKRRVADKAIKTYKQRLRQLTRRTVGRSMSEVVEKLKVYVIGWKAYFKLADTPRIWRELDEWRSVTCVTGCGPFNSSNGKEAAQCTENC